MSMELGFRAVAWIGAALYGLAWGLIATDKIEQVYNETNLGPGAMEAQDAAEILLVARWFKLHPEERKRTISPERWLAEKAPARGKYRRRRERRTTLSIAAAR